ncbi:family 43 glycosylhydrolase [Rhodopirellula sp. MGV]|uniref:family 43 glycosylhydrolase n=1 Tax=Rhodopirellula sp. MGV TaxID=2023130 RepID=UPI0013040B62|nr:family 43 glycosylhydrolase [Rhodopirellula sp. MGV]
MKYTLTAASLIRLSILLVGLLTSSATVETLNAAEPATDKASQAAAAMSPPGKPGSQTPQQFSRDQTVAQKLDYLLYLPKNYEANSGERYPLVLFLHGAGERGNNLDLVKKHGPPKLVEAGQQFPFVLVSPQCPTDQTWDQPTLSGLLDEIIATHSIDVDRVYLTGLSMGGYGTWDLGLAQPERFAAIAPICGGGELLQVLLVPSAKREVLQQLPVRVFHGGKDPVVPVGESERMVEGLKRLGAKDVELTVYPEASHDSWTQTYDNPAFFDWMLKQNRSGSNEPSLSGNPVFKGWYADPEGIVFDDTYWIFPTYSAPYNEQTFFDCFSSKDLVTWTKHEHILDNKEVKWAWRAMWAPSIIRKDGKYFFFFGANDIQNNDAVGGIGVAVADQPSGPYKDYLGKPLVDKFHNGAQPIDQFVFKDADGTHYLIYGGWRHCNIARLKDDFTGFVPFEDGSIFKEITPEGYVEGPFMFIRDGKYYFMWSEGGWTGPNYSVAYGVADSPFGPFKRIAKVLKQDPEIGTGAGHHSVIQVPGTEKYYAVYHRRPIGETDGNSRVVCIDPMEFDENGLIKPIKITNEGVAAQTIDAKE